MKFKSIRFLLPLGVFAGISASENASAASFLIDFGLNNSAGSPTAAGPDANGHYWNNVYSGAAAGTTISGGSGNNLSNLISTTNVASTISLALSGGTQPWSASGGSGFGGLLAPNPSLLGDFAIATATQDYFFVGSAGTATITLSGLSPSLTYNFLFYGGRDNTQTRTTRYTITDNLGSQFVDLQTSGTGIGTNTTAYPTGYSNGNDDQIVSLTGRVPTSGGNLTLTLSNVTGDFSYLGTLGIVSVPEPSTSALAGLAALALVCRRRRA